MTLTQQMEMDEAQPEQSNLIGHVLLVTVPLQVFEVMSEEMGK